MRAVQFLHGLHPQPGGRRGGFGKKTERTIHKRALLKRLGRVRKSFALQKTPAPGRSVPQGRRIGFRAQQWDAGHAPRAGQAGHFVLPQLPVGQALYARAPTLHTLNIIHLPAYFARGAPTFSLSGGCGGTQAGPGRPRLRRPAGPAAKRAARRRSAGWPPGPRPARGWLSGRCL